MEEKQFDEKKSLELISQMINATKRRAVKGEYNTFLLFGYTAAGLSVSIFFAVHFTGNPSWAAGWFLMFIPCLIVLFRRKKPDVVTYIDSTVNKIWQTTGYSYCLSACLIVLFGICFPEDNVNFALMLPLALIFMGIGTAMTAVVVKEERVMMPGSSAAIAGAVLMLICGIDDSPGWHLVFGFIAFLTMSIPGHILNRKVRKS